MKEYVKKGKRTDWIYKQNFFSDNYLPTLTGNYFVNPNDRYEKEKRRR